MCFFAPLACMPPHLPEDRTNLELSSFLKLIVVTLTLDGAVGGEHHVLVRTIDVLLPHRQPCTCLIMLDLFPLMPFGGNRDRSFFADVDGDLLGVNPRLEMTCFWMLATSTEKTRRFDAEVAHFLSSPVP